MVHNYFGANEGFHDGPLQIINSHQLAKSLSYFLPPTSASLSQTTPITELRLHFDLNCTSVKITASYMHDSIMVINICPQAEI